MRADLAHGRFAKADLTSIARKVTCDHGEEGLATDCRGCDSWQTVVIDGDLDNQAVRNRGDGLVMFKA